MTLSISRIAILLLVSLIINQEVRAQIIINELKYNDPGGDIIEIKNIGTSTVDISSWWLCTNAGGYQQFSGQNVVSGSTNLAPGALLVIDGYNLLDGGADLGIYETGNFGNSSDIRAYVKFGAGAPAGRESVAVGAGIWTTNDFVPDVVAGNSIEYDGIGILSSDWTDQPAPTFSSENEFLQPYVVFNTTDAGPGSLRQAIIDANGSSGETVIFQIPGAGPWTISLSSAHLPDLISPMIIDGTPNPGGYWCR